MNKEEKRCSYLRIMDYIICLNDIHGVLKGDNVIYITYADKPGIQLEMIDPESCEMGMDMIADALCDF